MSEIKGYEPETYSVADIQKKLGIGVNQAYELCHSGQFHTLKIGRTIKVPKEAFEDWFHGRKREL